MSELQRRLQEQNAANQKALAYKQANAKAVRAAQKEKAKRPDQPVDPAKKQRPVGIVNPQGFKFYFTSSFIDSQPDKDGINAIQKLVSDYQRFVGIYGDGWPVGLIQLSAPPPYLAPAGIEVGKTSAALYFQGTRLISLDQLDYREFPEALEDPIASWDVSTPEPTVLRFGSLFNPRIPAQSIVADFSGELIDQPSSGDHVVLLAQDSFWWDVDGWPAIENGPMFPATIEWRDPVTVTYNTVTWQRPYERILVSCSPLADNATECKLLTTVGISPGFYRERWRIPGTGEIVDAPGFETVTYQEPVYEGGGLNVRRLLPTYSDGAWLGPDPLLHSFRPSILTACRDAAHEGMIICSFFGPGLKGEESYFEIDARIQQTTIGVIIALLQSKPECLALDFMIRLDRQPFDREKALFAEWLALQYPIAKKIENELNASPSFFVVGAHSWGGPESLIPTTDINDSGDVLFSQALRDRPSPFRQLGALFDQFRYLAFASFRDQSGKDAAVDSAFAYLSREQRQQIKDIHRIRLLAGRELVNGLMGPSAVAYAQDSSSFATYPGRLEYG